MICRLKLELPQGKRIHSCIVTVHQEPDYGPHGPFGMGELLRDESGCHRSNPQPVSRDMQLIKPIAITEFPLEILLFAPDYAEVQNQQARDNQKEQPVKREYECD